MVCAIVDANVAHEVFGSSPKPAGEKFFEWINKGTRRLVAGGKQLEELEASSAGFREWATGAVVAGKMRIVNKGKLDIKAEQIQSEGACESNDSHIIALAQVSGSRMLYSNDRDLQRDFGKRSLVDSPPGKVYSTLKTKNYTRTHRTLLRQSDLCQVEG